MGRFDGYEDDIYVCTLAIRANKELPEWFQEKITERFGMELYRCQENPQDRIFYVYSYKDKIKAIRFFTTKRVRTIKGFHWRIYKEEGEDING
jgi:hypothetical protein